MDCCTRIGRLSTHITYTLVPLFTNVRRPVTNYPLWEEHWEDTKRKAKCFLPVCVFCLSTCKWPSSTWGWSHPLSWGWLFWSFGGGLWSHEDSPLSQGDSHPEVTEAHSGLVEARPAWAQLGFPFLAQNFISRNNGTSRKLAFISRNFAK
jgi:hypothetical protein